MVTGEIQILDYSSSQIIAISIGKAKIQEGNFKLIHIIDLENYQSFVNEINPILQNQITSKHPLFPYLNHELNEVKDLLENLVPHKKKRSINEIGTVWKWIAGNPDHEDFKII